MKLPLMVGWSVSVSISCFKVQSSIGHLVWFFDSGNSILSGGNSWYDMSAIYGDLTLIDATLILTES